jgi:hypothetical protein
MAMVLRHVVLLLRQEGRVLQHGPWVLRHGL